MRAIVFATKTKSDGGWVKLPGYEPLLILDRKVTHFTALIIRRFSRETFLVNYSETTRASVLPRGLVYSPPRSWEDARWGEGDRIGTASLDLGIQRGRVIFEGNVKRMEERSAERVGTLRASSRRSREKSGIAACEVACSGNEMEKKNTEKEKESEKKSRSTDHRLLIKKKLGVATPQLAPARKGGSRASLFARQQRKKPLVFSLSFPRRPTTLFRSPPSHAHHTHLPRPIANELRKPFSLFLRNFMCSLFLWCVHADRGEKQKYRNPLYVILFIHWLWEKLFGD